MYNDITMIVSFILNLDCPFKLVCQSWGGGRGIGGKDNRSTKGVLQVLIMGKNRLQLKYRKLKFRSLRDRKKFCNKNQFVTK